MPLDTSLEMKRKMIALLRKELPVLRARLRFSQEEVANRIGISRQTYSIIETGKREMSWTAFLALLALFQNHENTRQMLNQIDGFSEGVEQIISPQKKK